MMTNGCSFGVTGIFPVFFRHLALLLLHASEKHVIGLGEPRPGSTAWYTPETKAWQLCTKAVMINWYGVVGPRWGGDSYAGWAGKKVYYCVGQWNKNWSHCHVHTGRLEMELVLLTLKIFQCTFCFLYKKCSLYYLVLLNHFIWLDAHVNLES